MRHISRQLRNRNYWNRVMRFSCTAFDATIGVVTIACSPRSGYYRTFDPEN